MYRFIETIKLENGTFFRTDFHRKRVEATFAAFFPDIAVFNPVEVLRECDFPKTGLYKCRIEYSAKPELVEFVAYQRRDIKTLKLVEISAEPSAFKSTDRKQFVDAFALRGECDDVLMVRNGLLTDTSYANVALWNGTKWLTPAQPALFGTQRAYLLANGIIAEAEIRVDDLLHYSRIRVFNAMIEFGEIDLDLNCIR